MVVGTVAQGSVLCTPFKCCSFEEAECHLPPGSASTAAILHSGRSRDDQVWEGMGSMSGGRREEGLPSATSLPHAWLPLAT